MWRSGVRAVNSAAVRASGSIGRQSERGVHSSGVVRMVVAPPTHNAGILGLEQYFPRTAISQTVLEAHDKVSAGKYTKGLEQQAMAFCGDREGESD
jgi:hypothetical protein